MSVLEITDEHDTRQARGCPVNLYGLTPREAEVGQHLARGSDCRQISQALGVCLATVHTHRMHLMRKVSARNGAHLSLILSSLPGIAVQQATVVNIDDFRTAFGLGPPGSGVDADILEVTERR